MGSTIRLLSRCNGLGLFSPLFLQNIITVMSGGGVIIVFEKSQLDKNHRNNGAQEKEEIKYIIRVLWAGKISVSKPSEIILPLSDIA